MFIQSSPPSIHGGLNLRLVATYPLVLYLLSLTSSILYSCCFSFVWGSAYSVGNMAHNNSSIRGTDLFFHILAETSNILL